MDIICRFLYICLLLGGIACSSDDDVFVAEEMPIDIKDRIPEILSLSDSVCYASMTNKDTISNCAYIIDLTIDRNNETLVLDNVILGFKNGNILKNTTITGHYTIITDDNQQIADTTVIFKGFPDVPYWSIRWFGAKGNLKYEKNQKSLIDKGYIDDTPYINYTIRQSCNNKVRRIFIPKGNYIIRNSVLYKHQIKEGQVELTNKCAINMFDDMELFGQGDASLLVVEDILNSSDYISDSENNWNRLHYTGTAIGLAKWSEEEMKVAGYSFSDDHRFRYFGRHNVKIHGFAIDCRNSYRNTSLYKDVCCGISMFTSITNNQYAKGRGNWKNNEIYNMYIYNANAGIRVRNLQKQSKLMKNVSINNNRLEKGSNKAIEISHSDSCFISNNVILNYETGLQAIFNANYNTFENNKVQDSRWGIHITQGASFNNFRNNEINSQWQALIFKQDADDDLSATWTTKGNVIINNVLKGNATNTDYTNTYTVNSSNTLFCFFAWLTTDTNFNTYRYKDNLLKDNTLIGKDVYLGFSNRLSRSFIQMELDGLTLENNNIQCRNLILSNDRENQNKDIVNNIILRDNKIKATSIQNYLGSSSFIKNEIYCDLVLVWGDHIINNNIFKNNGRIVENNANYSGINY